MESGKPILITGEIEFESPVDVSSIPNPCDGQGNCIGVGQSTGIDAFTIGRVAIERDHAGGLKIAPEDYNYNPDESRGVFKNGITVAADKVLRLYPGNATDYTTYFLKEPKFDSNPFPQAMLENE